MMCLQTTRLTAKELQAATGRLQNTTSPAIISAYARSTTYKRRRNNAHQCIHVRLVVRVFVAATFAGAIVCAFFTQAAE